jgi:hypothetical protein
MEHANLLREALQRAGIESWLDSQGESVHHKGIEFATPRVMVAADQLEQARVIAANPIPEQTVEEQKNATPVFEMPRCPHCGAKDPALEGVDPFNLWRCESCGNQWTEPEEEQAPDAGEGNEKAL